MLEKYQKLLNECKKKSRATSIWCWHEVTLSKMRLNLIELKKKSSIARQTTSLI